MEDFKKIPTSADRKGSAYEENPEISRSSDEGGYHELSEKPFGDRITRLEVLTDVFQEKLISDKNSKRWMLGIIITTVTAIIAIVGIAFGAFNIYINMLKDSQDAYRNLQKDYYQALIDFSSKQQIEIDNQKDELDNLRIKNPYLK